jgi:hypothetical protein
VQLARAGSYPGRRRGPLSGVDLPCRSRPAAQPVTQSGYHRPIYFALQKVLLFDQLVGGRQQRFRDGQAERLGGFQVDDELELGRLHDRAL